MTQLYCYALQGPRPKARPRSHGVGHVSTVFFRDDAKAP